MERKKNSTVGQVSSQKCTLVHITQYSVSPGNSWQVTRPLCHIQESESGTGGNTDTNTNVHAYCFYSVHRWNLTSRLTWFCACSSVNNNKHNIWLDLQIEFVVNINVFHVSYYLHNLFFLHFLLQFSFCF